MDSTPRSTINGEKISIKKEMALFPNWVRVYGRFLTCIDVDLEAESISWLVD